MFAKDVVSRNWRRESFPSRFFSSEKHRDFGDETMLDLSVEQFCSREPYESGFSRSSRAVY